MAKTTKNNRGRRRVVTRSKTATPGIQLRPHFNFGSQPLYTLPTIPINPNVNNFSSNRIITPQEIERYKSEFPLQVPAVTLSNPKEKSGVLSPNYVNDLINNWGKQPAVPSSGAVTNNTDDQYNQALGDILDRANQFLQSQDYIPSNVRFLRSIGPVGTALQVFRDAVGIDNNPDYSKVDVYRSSSGNLRDRRVSSPYGFMRANTVNPETWVNSGAGTLMGGINTLKNMGNHNIGAVNSAMFKWLNDTSGQIRNQALDYNNKQYQDAAKFNYDVSKDAADLQAKMANLNAELGVQRANMGMKIGDAIWDATDMASQAKAQNLSTFYDTMTNFGEELNNIYNANAYARLNPGGLFEYLYANGRVPQDLAESINKLAGIRKVGDTESSGIKPNMASISNPINNSTYTRFDNPFSDPKKWLQTPTFQQLRAGKING